MRKYEDLGFCPQNVKNDFSNDICGICHDENNWYISQGSAIKMVPANGLDKNLNYIEKVQSNKCPIYRNVRIEYVSFSKYYKSTDENTPVGVNIKGPVFGDIDCYNDYIFVPISATETFDSQILVFSKKNFDCVAYQILYKKDGVPFKRLNWCAVNPQDECLYTSDAYISPSFEGNHSPILAFKIDFRGLSYCVRSCLKIVNNEGIKLQRKKKVNSDDTVPYILDAEVRGGCFDPFDTLYLSANTSQEEYVRNKAYYLWQEKGSPLQSDDKARDEDWIVANSQIENATEMGRSEREGITAFTLKRENSTSDQSFIQTTAYYIWKNKNSPLQNLENRDKDWLDAKKQINASVLSGMRKSDGVAFAAIACVKAGISDYTNDSIIDFLFDEKKSEEPVGITYWDQRFYVKDEDSGCSWNDGCLHALKLKRENSLNAFQLKESSFSLRNYVLRNLETESIIIEYDPNHLKVEQNYASGRYLVVSDSVLIKEFASKDEAEKAKIVMAQFKSIVLTGRCASNDERYDLCHDFLYERVSSNSKLSGVKFKTVRFDCCRVDNMRNVVENKWKQDYEVVLELRDYESLNEKYQRFAFPVHNTSIGSLIEDIVVNHSSFSPEKGGRLNYITSSSNRRRDSFYWFD